MRRAAALSIFLLAGCGSPEKRAERASEPALVLPGAKGAAIEIVSLREMEEIAQLEDARSVDDGRLFELLGTHRDARVRARAATALARFPFPRHGTAVTEALVRALEDPELEVKLAAAFALGVRADPTSAGTLLAYRNDPDARLRARVVEAASKLADPDVHTQVALSLRDSDLAVRMEAAVGAARWDRGESGAGETDRALLDALLPYQITRGGTPKSAVEAELVWRILWSLGRRRAELGRGPFLQYSSSDVVLERLFALRGLGQLAPDAAGLRAALAALVGPDAASDWRIAYEAAVTVGRLTPALNAGKDEASKALREQTLQALAAAVEHTSAHVRASAMEALGSLGDNQEILALLQRGRLDLSVSVRAAALRARVRIARPDDTLETLERGAKDDDPVVRAAAADAAGALRDARVVPILAGLARDPALFVATRAVEQLGQHPSDAVRNMLHGFLAHPDNGMRLAAVLALAKMPAPADVAPLILAAASSTGDVAAEIAFNVLEVLAKIKTDEALAAIEEAQFDPRHYVRTVARRLMRDSFQREPAATEPAFAPDREVPLPGKDYPLHRFNPMVELETTRGSMVVELFPAEAPVHVHNFLTLVERGHFDGLTFHRVVPDFVVQGGDYRGDGNGAQPYSGEALRAEFTPRKTTRGSLGMPRNDDPDSGGSQFFLTHVPTPHLDGRYTFFGELRTGGDVLDQLEVGDRILAARPLR